MKFTLNFLLKTDKVKNDAVKTSLSIDVKLQEVRVLEASSFQLPRDAQLPMYNLKGH